MRPRRVPWQLAAALVGLAAPAASVAQQPILEVRLVGVGQILIEGRLTEDGTLELPARPLQELTGERLSDLPFLSLEDLAEALGAKVDVDYQPRSALLLLRDPLRSLSATRAAHDRRVAAARSAPREFSSAGPFGTLTADSDGGRLVEAGWSFGAVALHGSHSTISGARWGVSVRPLTDAWVSYSDGDTRRSARFALRWARGRTFLQSAYSPEDGSFQGQLATSVGRWTAFVQDDGSAAVIFRGDLHAAIARTPRGYATSLSFGRNPSSLILPQVR